jgi:anti-anti-sigma regulatory factor
MRVGEKLRLLIAEPKPKVLVLDLSAVFDFEYTALKMLTDAERKIREEQGVVLWLVGLNPDVLAMVRRCPLGEALGNDRMFFNMDMAVARYLADQAHD